MRCANSNCGQVANDIFQGKLWLVELKVEPEDRIIGDEAGFPVCTVPCRYFWLCPDCSKTMEILKWTTTEVVVAPFVQGKKKPVSATSSHYGLNSMEARPLSLDRGHL